MRPDHHISHLTGTEAASYFVAGTAIAYGTARDWIHAGAGIASDLVPVAGLILAILQIALTVRKHRRLSAMGDD